MWLVINKRFQQDAIVYLMNRLDSVVGTAQGCS